jgi:hypothetical protein
MRRYGQIDGVDFDKVGFNIYNLAFEYTLREFEGDIAVRKKSVYVNNMKELREEIKKFNEEDHEEN